jgi:asparagine synthase (glutamine-hydrolysing)
MSAIAGLYRTDGQPAHRHEVDRMIAAVAHRGPDGTGTWSDGATALAHGAMWTTPESRRERQPLGGDAGSAIVADVRLDNRCELMAALDLGGRLPGEIGDSELILRAYERWDENCAAKLVGDFAFAIWDGRRHRLFCARDHVGVKPFYYHHAATAFLFASEIKALLTSPMVPYRLNPVRVADYLVGLFDDRAITFYRDIYRLPAGHTLTVSRDGARVRPYWSLDPTRELRLGSDEAYAEAFRECFTEAVRSRLRSDFRVGSLLSGGLDTSSIVATARHVGLSTGDGKLDTFTAIFPGLPAADLRKIDERKFVDAMLAQGGVRAHYVRGDLLSPLGDVDRVLEHMHEPYAAPNLYLHWGLYAAARQQGVRALLDGIDGDTTVSHGLESLADLMRRGRLAPLARELRALSRRYGVGVPDLFRQLAVRPLIPNALRQGVRWLRGRGPAFLVDTVVKPEFARRMGLAERIGAFERTQERQAASARAAHGRAMRSGLIPYALELADRAAAAFNIEPRYPFFDRRLMELCLAMPADQKLSGGWTRLVMRRAMASFLPEPVRWRSTKANLAPNFKRRLLAQDGDLLRDVVREQSGVLEDYVDIPALRRAYDRYVAQPTLEADALTVYSAAVLALWLQRSKLAA